MNLLDYHRGSVKLQLDHLLHHVKERFSEVLLPVENITKLEMFGKGNGSNGQIMKTNNVIMATVLIKLI